MSYQLLGFIYTLAAVLVRIGLDFAAERKLQIQNNEVFASSCYRSTVGPWSSALFLLSRIQAASILTNLEQYRVSLQGRDMVNYRRALKASF